jgi:NodT family efflux transporter outer membrane factor (OMF) lipoprotein
MAPRLIPLAALLLAGCASVAPAPSPSSVALPPAYTLADDESAAAANLADLLPRGDSAYATLEQAALADAPTLAAALARIDAARAAARGAGAARLPAIDGNASVTRQENNTARFGGAPIDSDNTSYQLGLSASWDLDLFGRLRASQRAATARLDAADADAAGVRLALASDIAVAVRDWRELDAREAVIRDDLARALQLVELTGVRSRAGLNPGFDLVRAQSLAADAQARLDPVAADRASVIGRLVRLTARDAGFVRTALMQGSDAPLAPIPDLGLPSGLLRSRPDVAAAAARLAASDAEIAAAAADRFPRLSISGTLGLLSLSLGNLFEEDALVGTLGASLAGPLVDFGRVGARIDQRQADAQEAFATYRGVVFQAIGETEAALGSIAALDRRVATLERQIAIDTDAVALSRERYRLGLDSLLPVIDAERTLNASRSALTAARGNAARARIALYRAVGSGQSIAD